MNTMKIQLQLQIQIQTNNRQHKNSFSLISSDVKVFRVVVVHKIGREAAVDKRQNYWGIIRESEKHANINDPM
jgi:hypothetical protein